MKAILRAFCLLAAFLKPLRQETIATATATPPTHFATKRKLKPFAYRVPAQQTKPRGSVEELGLSGFQLIFDDAFSLNPANISSLERRPCMANAGAQTPVHLWDVCTRTAQHWLVENFV